MSAGHDRRFQVVQEAWIQDGQFIRSATGACIATAAEVHDAQRIVAALNAVEGLPIGLLEDGLITRLLAKHATDLEEAVPGLKELLITIGRDRLQPKQ